MLKFNLFMLLALLACTNPVAVSTEPLTKVEIDHKWVLVNKNNNIQYEVFFFDNGPDYASEGLYRIVKNGKIGFAEENTNRVVIQPQFDCAFPFENGKAKVSTQCTTVKDGEHSIWESNNWQYIDKQGNITK